MNTSTQTPVDARRSATRRRPWRGLALVLIGALLGGILAIYALPAQSNAIGSAQERARTADSLARSYQATLARPSSAVPVPAIDKLAEQAINDASPAVVKVVNVGTGLGSGVILTPDGYIVTNNHVVTGATQLAVTLATGRTVPARLVGVDPVDDLAVVKVSARKLPSARFANSADLRVGQTVLAIGNPLGIGSTVTEGIVSALNRSVSEGQGGGSILNAIQTSASINPGNSGGALISLGGQVVGIPTLNAVDPQFNMPASGAGFAIPANTVQRIVTQLIRYGKVVHSGRAALGIYPEDVTPQLAAQYGLPIDRGVLVAQLTPGGPAQKAGVQAGDVLIQIDGAPITTSSDMLDLLAGKKPGQTAKLTVVTPQSGQRTYAVTLGELPVSSNG